jgi:Permeases of the major facilitator superfamily
MKLTKQEISWVLYDVANSAFTMVLTATIPIFARGLIANGGVVAVCNNAIVNFLFSGNAAKALAGDLQAFEAIQSSLFGLTTTIAVIIVAVLAPIVGAVADYKGMKKKLFSVALVIGIGGLLSLGITEDWTAYLVLIIIARIGYSSCNIFYDSMLTDVTTDERMDYVSSLGYAWGYIGSCIPFVLGIVLIFMKPFGLSTAQATQLSFILTAVWWLLMTIPLLKNVKQTHYLEKEGSLSIGKIFGRVFNTLKKISKDKKMLYFIVAYFFYIDGVYTIISMATTYGAEVGIGDTDMIIALLVTQFVAFPAAIAAGTLAKKFGPLKMIRYFIISYIAICVFGFQLDQTWEFWVLAVSVGLVQGGIQSLSRSYFGKIVPKKESNEYFGFFDIFGKFADFMGPLFLTLSATLLGSSKYGVLALILLFLVGLFLVIKIEKMEKDV